MLYIYLCSTHEINFIRIPTEKFVHISHKIEKKFPKETAGTYYTPYRQISCQKIVASGKLYDHFNYIKSTLRASQNLQPKQKTNKSSDNNDALELTGKYCMSIKS